MKLVTIISSICHNSREFTNYSILYPTNVRVFYSNTNWLTTHSALCTFIHVLRLSLTSQFIHIFLLKKVTKITLTSVLHYEHGANVTNEHFVNYVKPCRIFSIVEYYEFVIIYQFPLFRKEGLNRWHFIKWTQKLQKQK